jgi:hypothetical protein
MSPVLALVDVGDDLDDLAKQINKVTLFAETEAKAAEMAAELAMGHALEAGALLAKAKQLLPHGQWETWLGCNCNVAARTARAYMQLAKRFSAMSGEERQRVAVLPVREAIRAITTKPEAPARPSSALLAVAPRDERERALVALDRAGRALRATRRNLDRFSSLSPKDIDAFGKKIGNAKQALQRLSPGCLTESTLLPQPEPEGPSDEEIREAEQSAAEDLAAAQALLAADDPHAYLAAENKRLTHLTRHLQERINGLMGEKDAAVRSAKYWQRKAEQAEKQAAL